MFQYNAAVPAVAYGAAYADVLFTTNSPNNGAQATLLKLPPFQTAIAIHVVNPDSVGVKVTVYGSNDGLNFDVVVAEYTVALGTNKLQLLAAVAYGWIKVAMKQDTTANSLATASIRVVPHAGS